MGRHARLMGLVAVATLFTGADLLACGDKFLVAGRGTRYQRPKNARAASVLIYANPSAGQTVTVKNASLDSVLKREGHRATVAETPDQLAAFLQGARYDVVLAASSVVAAVEKLLAGPDAPVVVAFCPSNQRLAEKNSSCVKSPVKERALLEAIDKAVEQRDRNTRRTQTHG